MTENSPLCATADRRARAQAALERLGCQKLARREPQIVRGARKLASLLETGEIPGESVATHFSRSELRKLLVARRLDKTEVLALLYHFGQPCPRCWRTLRALAGKEKTTCSLNPLVTSLQLLSIPAGNSRPDPIGRLLQQAPRDPIAFGRLILESADSAAPNVARALGSMRDACLIAAVLAFGLERGRSEELLGWCLSYLARAECRVEWDELCREDLTYGWRYCLEARPAPELEAMLLVTEAYVWRLENRRDLAIFAMEEALRALEGFEHLEPEIEVLLDLAPTLASRGLSHPVIAMTRALRLCCEGGERIHPTLVLRVIHNLAKANICSAVHLLTSGKDPEPALAHTEECLAMTRPLYAEYDFEHLRLDREKIRSALAQVRELGADVLECRGPADAPDPDSDAAGPRRSSLSREPE